MHYPLIVPNYLTSSGGEIVGYYSTFFNGNETPKIASEYRRERLLLRRAPPFDMDQHSRAIMDSELMGTISNFLSTPFFSSIWKKKLDTILYSTVSTLTYQINVPARLSNFEKKPWLMFCDYFWAVQIISIDCLDSWRSVRSKTRNQVNQLK